MSAWIIVLVSEPERVGLIELLINIAQLCNCLLSLLVGCSALLMKRTDVQSAIRAANECRNEYDAHGSGQRIINNLAGDSSSSGGGYQV